MSTVAQSAGSRTVVHRPAPRGIIYACMVLLAVIALPAYILKPESGLSVGDVLGIVVVLLFETLLVSLTLRQVVLSMNAEGDVLRIRGVRWPLAEQNQELPVEQICEVVKQRAPRSRAVRLALLLRTGEHVALTRSYFGDSSRMERDAAAIRALCALKQDLGHER